MKNHSRQRHTCTITARDEEHEVHLKGFHKRLLVSGREQVKEPPWWPRTVILLTQEAKAEGSQVQSLSGLQCKFKASLENLVGVCLPIGPSLVLNAHSKSEYGGMNLSSWCWGGRNMCIP